MRNVILLCAKGQWTKKLSFGEANQLLHHGLAQIAKFYPFTLQLKSFKQNGPDELEESNITSPPLPDLPMAAKSQKKNVKMNFKIRGMQSLA